MKVYLNHCSLCGGKHQTRADYTRCVLIQREKIEVINQRPRAVSSTKEYREQAYKKWASKKENVLKRRERDYQRYYRMKALGIRVGGNRKPLGVRNDVG